MKMNIPQAPGLIPLIILLNTLVLLPLGAQNSVIYQGAYPLETHLRVMALDRAREPQLEGNRVIFTYQATEPPRIVSAVFDHENFRRRHVFLRNPQGIFFLVYDLPENTTELRYRLVVDGLWQTDPGNPQELRSQPSDQQPCGS